MRKILLLLFISSLAIAARAQGSNDDALAMQYYQNGDFEKAVVLYEKLFTHSKNQAYYDPYFNSLLKLKRYDDASALAKKQLKISPGNYTYSIDIGRVYQESGQQEKAAEWYSELVKNLPKNEYAIRDLATGFYRAEAYDFAIRTLIAGRKLLDDENAFSFDLLGLYRYRKDKAMLVYEYVNLIAVTPELLPQAENVLSGIFDDKADYDLLKATLLRRLQKDPQNVVFTEFLTWQFVQQKEFDMALRQTLALDRRLREDGERVYDLSRLLINNKAYDPAIAALNYIVSKGSGNRLYIQARVDLIDVKTKLATAGKYSASDLAALEKDYLSLLQEFGRNSGTSFAMRQLANLQAFYMNKPNDAEAVLEEVLRIPALSASATGQTKLELGDIYIITGEVWEAALIYGQAEKQFSSEAAGQEARFRNAKLAYYQGDFDWAKAQLDVLKGSTSQLIANDALNLSLLITENLQNEKDTAALKKYAAADLLIFKNMPDKALVLLDSIGTIYSENSLSDDILMARARVFIAKSDFLSAAAQLQKVIDSYSFDLWGDDAAFMLAELYENSLNQPDKARQLYQKLITDFPGSLFVAEARKRFRILRGDNPGT